jgi:hypothetical protein
MTHEVGSAMQQALEDTHSIPDETVAFRKGKGCDGINHLIIAMKEDAIESGEMIILLLEDEEKFFDRITVCRQSTCGQSNESTDVGQLDPCSTPLPSDWETRNLLELERVGTVRIACSILARSLVVSSLPRTSPFRITQT